MKKLIILACTALFVPGIAFGDTGHVATRSNHNMSLIPAGKFLMGDHHDGIGDALPLHAVTLDAFYIGKYEITNRQYCEYLNSALTAGKIKVLNGVVYSSSDMSNSYPYCDTHAHHAGSQIDYSGGVFKVRKKDGAVDMSNHPMVHVSWYGAAAYCNWLSRREGCECCYDMATWDCDLSKNGYHLPLESQWEYAARGGKHSPYSRFPLGDTLHAPMANVWKSGDDFEKGEYPWTTPVGYYNAHQTPAGSDMANGYGLYDIEGNVQEWCNDWYRLGYADSKNVNNPTGPPNGRFRVLRGGFWKGYGYHYHFSRTAIRYREQPVRRYSYAGFRLARSAAGSPIASTAAGVSTTIGKKPTDAKQKPNDTRLLYKRPAQIWEDGLPLGNGQVGAMVLGGVAKDRIVLNHNRLWRRNRHQNFKPPKVGHLLKQAQNHYFAGNYAAGYKAAVFAPWSAPNSFAMFGDLNLHFPDHVLSNVSNYRGELDLATGTAKVSYVHDGTTYVRETFASRADDVIVVRLSADKKNAITSDIELSRISDPECKITGWSKGNRLGFKGRFAEGVEFAGVARIFNSGGKLVIPNENASRITADNCDEVTILVSLTTDKNVKPQADCIATCNSHLDKFKNDTTFAELLRRHVDIHKKMFERVELSFGGDPKRDLPTDERLALFAAGEPDPGLIPLQFQFGRYVVMCTSRRGCLPANLQGIWNGDLRPVWDSAYVTDCNLQMNYWAAEVTNLSECHEAFFGLFEDSLPAARQTAKDLYGCRGIFMAMHFGPQHPARCTYWEWSGAAAWLAQHFWWRWEYTQDKDFLRDRAYPIYKELGMFYEDFLVPDPRPNSPQHGKLVTVPSYSPEALFFYKGGSYTMTIGSTMDFHLIHDVFSNLIAASKILGVDADRRDGWQKILDSIPPMQVGRHGQVQEWLEDLEEKDLYHRHISHLWGLFPDERITPEGTPKFAKAAYISLQRKMNPRGAMCPWPAVWAWYAACFARLGESELAYELLENNLSDGGLAYRNLFTRPREGCIGKKVFQIDGNCAAPAAIAEMLMQSHNGEIKLLPALPKAWATGHVKGLVARGAFEIEMQWKGGKLTAATIKSKASKPCRIRYNLPLAVTANGKPVEFKREGDSVITFETKPGQRYELRPL